MTFALKPHPFGLGAPLQLGDGLGRLGGCQHSVDQLPLGLLVEVV